MTSEERMKSAIELAHAIMVKHAQVLVQKGYNISFDLRVLNNATKVPFEEQEYSLWVTIYNNLEPDDSRKMMSFATAYYWHNLEIDSPDKLYVWAAQCARDLPDLYTNAEE